MGKVSRLFGYVLLLLGLGLVSVLLFVFIQDYMEAREPKGKIENPVSIRSYDDFFDPFSGEMKQQFIEFSMLSEPFAADDTRKGESFYLAVDLLEDASYLFIVCMTDEQFKSFSDIYEYTFSDTEDPPPRTAVIYGYPAPIEEDLKALAIEYFDWFWGEDILTEDNFEDFVGSYYLDAVFE